VKEPFVNSLIMAPIPNQTAGSHLLGAISIGILVAKYAVEGYFNYVKPSERSTKYFRLMKIMDFVPPLLSCSWAAYHVNFALTSTMSIDHTCEEMGEMMNSDIGGVGARFGIYAPQITTLISMGLGHWHNKENGVKEACIVNIIST
jgi:hypothetical protein